MFNKNSNVQKKQLLSNLRPPPPTSEELIIRLEGELAATKLHLEAEINGRRAACNQLQSANSRIDQLNTENCELRSQLQQTQAQLEAARGPPWPAEDTNQCFAI